MQLLDLSVYKGVYAKEFKEFTQQKFICRLITCCNIYSTHLSKVWEQLVDDVYSILKCTHWENFFHHINNLHQNIVFTMEEESNGELAFLDSSLKQNNGKIYVFIHRKPVHTDQHLHYSCHYQTSFKERLFPPCLIEHI